MNNLKKLSLIIIAILSFSVNANNHANELYAGIGVIKTIIKEEGVKYNEVNLKIMGGMKINDNFAAEIQFINIKNSSILNVIYEGKKIDINVKGKIFAIAGLYYLNNQSYIKPFIKLGIHKWKLELEGNIDGINKSYTDNGNGTDLFGGIGIDIINDNFTTRVEFENYKFGNDVDLNMKSFGISAVFNF